MQAPKYSRSFETLFKPSSLFPLFRHFHLITQGSFIRKYIFERSNYMPQLRVTNK